MSGAFSFVIKTLSYIMVDELVEILQEMNENEQFHTLQAKNCKKFLDALTAEGFTRAEALEIVKASFSKK